MLVSRAQCCILCFPLTYVAVRNAGQLTEQTSCKEASKVNLIGDRPGDNIG